MHEQEQVLIGMLVADWFEQPGNFEDMLQHVEQFSSLRGDAAKQQLIYFFDQLEENFHQKKTEPNND